MNRKRRNKTALLYDETIRINSKHGIKKVKRMIHAVGEKEEFLDEFEWE